MEWRRHSDSYNPPTNNWLNFIPSFKQLTSFRLFEFLSIRSLQLMDGGKIYSNCMNNGARWIFTSLHTWIGLIYIIAGTLGGSLGTAYSLIMRWELGMPGYVLVISNFHDYNVWITYHGILMIFFMVMPLMIGGIGNLIVPIQLAAPDMVFPRLNNLSFWFLPFSLLFTLLSLLIENGFGGGWTLYAPLSSIIGHEDASVDLLIFAIHFAGISSLLGAINFISTLLRMRWTLEPYYYWLSLPFYSWSIFITAWLLVLTVPVFAAAVTLLLFDRHFNTSF